MRKAGHPKELLDAYGILRGGRVAYTGLRLTGSGPLENKSRSDPLEKNGSRFDPWENKSRSDPLENKSKSDPLEKKDPNPTL